MILKRFFMPILFGFMMTLASTAFAVGNATDSVRMSVDSIIGILKDAGLDKPAKREKIRVVIAERFDFRAMSQRTLATNWRKASKEEQQQFVELFAKLIQNTYIGRVEAYTNEEVQIPRREGNEGSRRGGYPDRYQQHGDTRHLQALPER